MLKCEKEPICIKKESSESIDVFFLNVVYKNTCKGRGGGNCFPRIFKFNPWTLQFGLTQLYPRSTTRTLRISVIWDSVISNAYNC